jgi:steroid delta-isomerase-like uncharacterized protein
MSADPKSVATRFYELMETPEALYELCSPDLRGHAGAGADLDQFIAGVVSFRESFPDLTAEVRHLVNEDDVVSTWVTYRGTHRGEFAGVPGSDREISIAGWDLMRIEDGKVVEITSYCDLFTLMNQIGALPTAAPA